MSKKVYKLGMRLSTDRHKKYQRLAEQAGCASIPAFVHYVVEQYQTVRPELEKLQQELVTVKAALERARADEEKVQFAHEEILAQFRKTITEMGEKQDAIHLERDRVLENALNEANQNIHDMTQALEVSTDRIDVMTAIHDLKKEAEKLADLRIVEAALRSSYNKLIEDYDEFSTRLHQHPYAVFGVLWRWLKYWLTPRNRRN